MKMEDICNVFDMEERSGAYILSIAPKAAWRTLKDTLDSRLHDAGLADKSFTRRSGHYLFKSRTFLQVSIRYDDGPESEIH
jgi:hypothetical protein